MRRCPTLFKRLGCTLVAAALVCAFGAPGAFANDSKAEDNVSAPVVGGVEGTEGTSGEVTPNEGTSAPDATGNQGTTSIPASSLKGKTFKTGGLSYKVTKATAKGAGTVTVVKRTSGKATATIPATVSKSYKVTRKGVTAKVKFTFRVTAVAAGAFNNTKGHKVRTLTVGANVVSIGKKAFYGCKGLTKVTFKGKALGNKTTYAKNGSVKKSPIGKRAFSGVPRSCNAYTPSTKGTNFGYIQGTRAALTYAGFKGVVF